MYKTRKATIIIDEDSSLTLIKPFLKENADMLFVIYEDAYGEMDGALTFINEVKSRLNLSDEEFNEIIKHL
jgi:hypothetical protein